MSALQTGPKSAARKNRTSVDEVKEKGINNRQMDGKISLVTCEIRTHSGSYSNELQFPQQTFMSKFDL